MSYYSALQGFGQEDEEAGRGDSSLATSECQKTGMNGETHVKSKQQDTGHSTMPETTLRQPLVWIDLEMTGLEPATDTIMEIACIVTDGSLEKMHEGPDIAICVSEDYIEGMNEWCQKHHHSSGLVERCRGSKVSLKDAEAQVLDFVQNLVPQPGQALLAGNTCHNDLNFLRVHMPRLASHLSYRICDVSTVMELAKRWFPREYYRAPRKKCAHTAMLDIRESIEELRYYKMQVFKPPARPLRLSNRS